MTCGKMVIDPAGSIESMFSGSAHISSDHLPTGSGHLEPRRTLDQMDAGETGRRFGRANAAASGLCRVCRRDREGRRPLAKDVDYGNFYLFLNGEGSAHIMLHEHREFLPRDPLSRDLIGEVTFFWEDGTQFAVPGVLTTSSRPGARSTGALAAPTGMLDGVRVGMTRPIRRFFPCLAPKRAPR